MFNKQDYLAYFQIIEDIESKMIKRSEETRKLFPQNKEALELIEHWHDDELKHKRICLEIEKLISKDL
jgi:hypothetical protein